MRLIKPAVARLLALFSKLEKFCPGPPFYCEWQTLVCAQCTLLHVQQTTIVCYLLLIWRTTETYLSGVRKFAVISAGRVKKWFVNETHMISLPVRVEIFISFNGPRLSLIVISKEIIFTLLHKRNVQLANYFKIILFSTRATFSIYVKSRTEINFYRFSADFLVNK